MKRKLLVRLGVLALAGGLVGCKGNNRPVNPEDFYRARSAATLPGTQAPASQPGLSSGQYMIVGAVVAEVNGQPIYANRVLGKLEVALSSKAKELPAPKFRAAATELIQRQVQDDIANELEVAAADHNLAAEDHQLAQTITADWRQQQITQAGGSLAVARKKAQDDGADFDEAVQQQYRSNLLRLYYQRKVIPLIQVSADDIRRYYQANLDKEFTVREAIRPRIIRIDVARTGTREQARQKIADLERRIRDGGEDFAALAGKVNDDPNLMRDKGLLDWVPRRTLNSEKFEDELWRLQPGQVTPIVEDSIKGATGELRFFYLGKLEERRPTQVIAFEDQEVQDKIRNVLRAEQLKKLRDQERQRLSKGAIIRFDPAMLDLAIEMAMQKYPRWLAAN